MNIEGQLAARRFFALLESRYGGLSRLLDIGPAAEVIRRDDGILRGSDLRRLASHEATAVHVKGFYERGAAEELGRWRQLAATVRVMRAWWGCISTA